MQSISNHVESQAGNAGSNPEPSCPYCHHPLTLREIITMMHGSGWERLAKVRLDNGTITLVEAGLVNPTQVEVLE